jgi:lipopolysaccharide/colanic/teichoic acid biosynthesis glycosyltransferase
MMAMDHLRHSVEVSMPQLHESAPALSMPTVAIPRRVRSRTLPEPRDQVARRVLNVVVASVALVLLSPLFLLIAIAVRLSSPGPVIYRQERVGLDRRWGRNSGADRRRKTDVGGRPFTIYKFRTMVADAEAKSGAVWAAQGDARVTRVGAFLRSTRLDELPQLWNVVRGDMNIVGPRPERPSIFVRLREDIHQYQLRQRVRPGITGLAQVSQSYDTCLDDVKRKVAYDIEYVSTSTFWDDVKIMLKTLPVMLFRRGGW